MTPNGSTLWERLINKVTCMDCLEGMKQMPDGCAELGWTDPPYNVGKDYGVYKDNLPDAEYLRQIDAVIREMKRICKAICMFTPHKYAREFWNLLGPGYRQIILPFRPEGGFRYKMSNQFAFLLTNAKPVEYCKDVWENCQMKALGWFFKESDCGHPGYTSEDITGRVLRYFTRDRDLVLDPFMGSGTTAKMCKKMDRDFIGFELDQKWIDICNQRLAQGVLGLKAKGK